MVQNEYSIYNEDGKLMCKCRESERKGDPDIMTKNGNIPLHELYRKALFPEKPRKTKGSFHMRNS